MEPPLELKDTKAVVDTKDQELKLARKKRGGVVKIKKNLDGKRKKPSIPRLAHLRDMGAWLHKHLPVTDYFQLKGLSVIRDAEADPKCEFVKRPEWTNLDIQGQLRELAALHNRARAKATPAGQIKTKRRRAVKARSR